MYIHTPKMGLVNLVLENPNLKNRNHAESLDIHSDYTSVQLLLTRTVCNIYILDYYVIFTLQFII